MERVINLHKDCKKVLKAFKNHKTVIEVNGFKIGNDTPFIIACPCAVENESQILTIAEEVNKQGVNCLRGGIFKPRTSPYAFQGLGIKGLELIKKAKKSTGLPIVLEVMDSETLSLIEKDVDILQIGSRNMFNYALLKKVAKSRKPILLKRGMSANLDEFLLATEYILKEGNNQIILCERGIKTFSNYTRYTSDLSIVPIIKTLSHLPIIVDPIHATGIKSLVPSMSKSALICGADGLMIEVHNKPDEALSDGHQSISLEDFE